MPIDNMPVAVVTGAARDIGLALVRTFLANGYRIIAVVRQKEDVDKISAIDPQHILAINCDISRKWLCNKTVCLPIFICFFDRKVIEKNSNRQKRQQRH